MCITGLTQYFEVEIQAGVQRFALNHPDWELGYIDARDAYEQYLDEALAWKPDGILLIARPSKVPRVLEVPDLPLVVVDLQHERPSHASRITVDDQAIGRRAAEYFLQQRFKHLAVVTPSSNSLFSQYRAEGFADTLLSHGLRANAFEVNRSSFRPWFSDPELTSWLAGLPKPVGIYCVQDLIAQRIVEHCRMEGLRVPSEISVVGTDNHRILCEAFRPFLSSIPQPLEACGFRAAEVLNEQIDQLRNGARPTVFEESLQPGEVFVRQSSSLRAIPDPAIAQAVNYLQDHTLKGCAISDAAREAGLNRRALERGFKKHLGVTPGAYMREIKLHHAKTLLAQTDLRMADIAEACLMTQEHFATIFREETGETPSHYRRKGTSPLERKEAGGRFSQQNTA